MMQNELLKEFDAEDFAVSSAHGSCSAREGWGEGGKSIKNKDNRISL
jgi:hypothetical protein